MMIIVHKNQNVAKRRFLLCKTLESLDGETVVTVWFQWVTRSVEGSRYVYTTEDGAQFQEWVGTYD